MKLSKITTASLVALTGLSLASTSAYAAEVGTQKTQADFELKAGEGGTGPVDPIDPIEPPMMGPLTLDAASNFNFGSIKLGEGDGIYTAIKEDNSVLKEYILNQNKTKDSIIVVLENNYLRTLNKIDSISNLTANSTTVINKHYHEKDSIINTYYYNLDTLDIVFSASINRITENSYQGKYDIPLLK